uniref:Uncharacterized protein n=1 Tax=Caulobacter sp. (strain K31) TaxID=366602 RepID=B0T9C6_CAUSK
MIGQDGEPWPQAEFWATGDQADRLEAIGAWLEGVPGGFCLPWPGEQGPATLRAFSSPQAWRAALSELDLDPACAAPKVVRDKYRRAQKLYLLAWIDGDVMLAGEMAAFTALELALNDQVGPKVAALAEKPRKKAKVSATGMIRTPLLADLLDYLVVHAGIVDEDFPTALSAGGTVVDRLRKVGPLASRPTLAETRNRLAHGDPFEGLPLGGLLHVVRDLIHYLYRTAPASP